MWTVAFFAFVALMILIAVPLQTIAAVLGAFIGYQLGYMQIGQGAGVAGGILGFLAGIGLGNELRPKLIPNWKPDLADVFSIAVMLCIGGAILAAVILVVAFIAETWSALLTTASSQGSGPT